MVLKGESGCFFILFCVPFFCWVGLFFLLGGVMIPLFIYFSGYWMDGCNAFCKKQLNKQTGRERKGKDMKGKGTECCIGNDGILSL